MKPGEKGWMGRFFDFKLEQLQSSEEISSLGLLTQFANSQEYLYHLIQPTGLMYGYPVRFIDSAHPRAKRWTDKERIKVLMAESYISTGLFYRYPEIQLLDQAVQLGITDIRDFYQQNFLRYRRPPRNMFSRGGTTLDQIEGIIEHRIGIQYDWRKIWANFFNNSLLFFDLIFFIEWMEREHLLPSESLAQRRQTIRFNMLQIIAAAAHSDNVINQEEKELFQFFLQSAHLPAPLKRKAESFLKREVLLDDLQFQEIPLLVVEKILSRTGHPHRICQKDHQRSGIPVSAKTGSENRLARF